MYSLVKLALNHVIVHSLPSLLSSKIRMSMLVEKALSAWHFPVTKVAV